MSINNQNTMKYSWELSLAPAGGEHVSWAIYGNLCSKKIRIHDNSSLTRNEVRCLGCKAEGAEVKGKQ